MNESVDFYLHSQMCCLFLLINFSGFLLSVWMSVLANDTVCDNKATLIVRLFALERKTGSQRGCEPPLCLVVPAPAHSHERSDHYGNAPEQPEVTRQRDLVWLNVDFKPTCDNAAISFHALGEQMIKHWSLLPSDANTSVWVCLWVCALFLFFSKLIFWVQASVTFCSSISWTESDWRIIWAVSVSLPYLKSPTFATAGQLVIRVTFSIML